MSPASAFGRLGLAVLLILNSPPVDAYFLNWNAPNHRIQPRQTTTSDVAPATTSRSAADRFIENIDRLDESIRDLPNDALNFFNEVGDKIESLESLFRSIIGSSSTSAVETGPTARLPIPTSLLAINSTANATVPLPTTIVPTPVTEPDAIFTILPILESLIPPLLTAASAATALPGYENATSLVAPTAPGSPFAPAIPTANVTTPAFSANVTSAPSTFANASSIPSLNSTIELPVFTNTSSAPILVNATSIPVANLTASAVLTNITTAPLFVNTTSELPLSANATLTTLLAANTSAPVYENTTSATHWANATAPAYPLNATSSIDLPAVNATSTPLLNLTSTSLLNATSSPLLSANATSILSPPANLTTSTPTPLFANASSSLVNLTTTLVDLTTPAPLPLITPNTTIIALIANITSALSISTYNATILASFLAANITTAPTPTPLLENPGGPLTPLNETLAPFANGTSLSLPTHMPIPLGPLSAANASRIAASEAAASITGSEEGGFETGAVVRTTTAVTSTDEAGVTYVWLSTVTVTTTVVVTPTPTPEAGRR